MRIFFSVVFALASIVTHAQSNDGGITKFRGLTFGEAINVQGMKPIERGKYVVFYQKAGESLTIGGGKVNQISYGVFDGKLSSVLIEGKGLVNFEAVKKTLVSAYGEPHRPNRYMEKYFWLGAPTMVTINYKAVGDEFDIAYIHKPTSAQIEQREKSDAEAGAKKDL